MFFNYCAIKWLQINPDHHQINKGDTSKQSCTTLRRNVRAQTVTFIDPRRLEYSVQEKVKRNGLCNYRLYNSSNSSVTKRWSDRQCNANWIIDPCLANNWTIAITKERNYFNRSFNIVILIWNGNLCYFCLQFNIILINFK